MAASILQLQHHAGQPFWLHLQAGRTLANVVVLAVQAVKIAASEENSPRTTISCQRSFFTKVRAVAGYPSILSYATLTDLAC
jgi:hypothetical protein